MRLGWSQRFPKGSYEVSVSMGGVDVLRGVDEIRLQWSPPICQWSQELQPN
eukprot:CAMPEP_0172892032 /NCGR_PEP_ID=MMETSP1075-20121228/145308_1 /TAXON_ID=2916 /ORGANISM="Ceratium fusus, Strain PA161109" /LENGTH=50 /DNA_ID=CAMNT_0013746599 /DNA_START=54 /DNA_END=206 /DNA_ORIENTATION=+